MHTVCLVSWPHQQEEIESINEAHSWEMKPTQRCTVLQVNSNLHLIYIYNAIL